MNNMFIKELIWKIKEPYVKRKRAYYERLWWEGKMSADEMCERVAKLYKAKPTRREEQIMEIENLISIVEEISLELIRVRDTIEPEEYESWFQDNLVQAHDLLLEVKDLLGA